MSAKSIASGNSTQSAYVATLIENDIIAGRLAPHSPLKSVRELAEAFKVTRTVVTCAMDILERRNLITRIPRKGVFVKGKTSREGIIDVVFFAMDREPAKSAFVTEMLQIIHSRHTHGDFNFTIRLASSRSERSVEHLDEEISRLEKFGYPDCAVVIPIHFTRKEVEMFLKLPYPVVFLGDFTDGDYDDLNYYRLAIKNKKNKCIVDYAIHKGYRSIMNIVARFGHEVEHIKKFNQALEDEGTQRGLKVTHLEIPGETYPEIVRISPFVFDKYRREIQESDMLFSNFIPFPEVDFALPERIAGFRKPDRQEAYCQGDHDKFFEAALSMIREAVQNPHERKITSVCLDHNIIINYEKNLSQS